MQEKRSEIQFSSDMKKEHCRFPAHVMAYGPAWHTPTTENTMFKKKCVVTAQPKSQKSQKTERSYYHFVTLN